MHSLTLPSTVTSNTAIYPSLTRKNSVNLPRKHAKVFPIPTCLEQHHNFEIFLVKTNEELELVYQLVHDAYVEEGYSQPQNNGKLIYFGEADQLKETHILVAKYKNKIVGTISITLDNNQFMPVPQTFHNEYHAIRNEGKKIGIVWRLAVAKSHRRHASILAKLIKNAISLGFNAGMNTALFTHHQKHENFSKKVLKMQVIARREKMTGFGNPPGSMMRLDKDACPSRWLIKPPVTNPLFAS